MKTFGLVLFIICLLGCLGVFAYAIYRAVRVTKNPMPKTIDYPYEVKTIGYLSIAHSLLFVICFIGVYLWQGLNASGLEWFLTIFGGLLTSFGLFALVTLFIIHYYGKEIPKNIDKWLFYGMISALPIMLVFFFVFSDGWANHIAYPLPNMLSFTKGFTSESGTAGIAFYALFILSGAIFVFLLCDHIFYKQYGKHGLIESTFLVAFPAGIIGARIAYVIGEWDKFAGQPWWKVFAIWEGGLTILGGAIGGIVVGVLWFMWRNKGYSIWLAVDIIVPTILIAQAIGRWGNFFNREVYGQTVDEKYWQWLPTIIFNQLHYTNGGALIGNGQVVVPLFLIESMTNMIGYFVLAGLFGKILRKYTELGDLAFGYLIWYGLTRVIMEPLRNRDFQMGSDKYWSWLWSLIFVLVGAALISANHFIRYLLKRKKESFFPQDSWIKNGLIGGGITLALTITFIAIGASLMISNPSDKTQLALDGFNNGTILVVIGCSLLLGAFIYIPYIIDGLKVRKKNHSQV